MSNMDKDKKPIPNYSPTKSTVVETESPLLMSSVLEALFRLLPINDIKTCRQVCRVWGTEGFRALRKCSQVSLQTPHKQSTFLKFEEAYAFTKFSFNISNWGQEISSYLMEIRPASIEVQVHLLLNKEDRGVSIQNFENLLRTQCRSLLKLSVTVDWAGTLRLVIPESLFDLQFPLMKTLCIKSDQIEAAWLHPLWLSIIHNSSKLENLHLSNIVIDELWKSVCTSHTFSKIRDIICVLSKYSDVLGMHQILLRETFPTALNRLCIPFQADDPGTLSRLLAKVADRLSILEFRTQDESALSPINFPTMPNLTVLDAGNSQFSFPTITLNTFPKLVEIRAMYWDWVYTVEDLPDVHYYWRTDEPHVGVTTFFLRFPSWSAMDIHYRRLENFNDFVEVMKTKFPRACNFTFSNVPLCADVRIALEKFTEVFEVRMKMLTIASYCNSEIVHASPLEVTPNVTDDTTEQRELEVLDLGSELWPAIWSHHPVLLSAIREEWLPALKYFNKLRCLKLLWAKNIFSALSLTDTSVLPELEHLEFVGNICIDRYERSNVCRKRPKLCLVQHKSCYCEEEDWWYMSDPESAKIFQNLFGGSKSFFHVPAVITKLILGFAK